MLSRETIIVVWGGVNKEGRILDEDRPIIPRPFFVDGTIPTPEHRFRCYVSCCCRPVGGLSAEDLMDGTDWLIK